MDRLVQRRLGRDIMQRFEALDLDDNEYGYDPFGCSKESLSYAAVIAGWLYRSYFRCEVHGCENVPARGRCLLVANHSGQLPFDALMTVMAIFLEPAQPRVVRSTLERFIPRVPFASYLLSRWGQIVGTPDNCLRLLEDEELVLVFPEGARGIAKPFSRRYQLTRFGRGFMRLALQTGAPVVPMAIIGAEEQAPAINAWPIARLLGAPSFPVVPYPPFFPVIPLPAKYRMYFGEPLTFTGDASDDNAVADNVAAVKQRIQSMIERGLEERRYVFW
ncbi:MAG: acyltransferase family protein [Proteobacteria bacterium]|nr:acyltransferase family protein [Pseudomonadota bacterium]